VDAVDAVNNDKKQSSSKEGERLEYKHKGEPMR